MKAFAKIAAAAAGLVLVLAGPAGAWESKNFDIKEVQKNDVVYKIHGDNRGDTKYKCNSFETRMGDKEAAVLHAKLATYAYQDGNLGYRYTAQDGTAVELTREQALHETGYRQLGQADVRKYIQGSRLNVDAEGNITGQSTDGLNAVLLEGPGGEIVIAYRGTNPNGQDIIDDAKQAAVALIVPKQYKEAAELLQAVLKNTKPNTQIICDGHSLGGGEVTYAMAATDLQGRKVEGYTYNAAGLSESTVESLDKDRVLAAAAHIVNIRNELDPVSYVGYHLGPTYEVTTRGPYDGDKHTLKNDHSIAHLTENMIAATGGKLAPKTAPQEGMNGKPNASNGHNGNNGSNGNNAPNPGGPGTGNQTGPNAKTGVEGIVDTIVELIREATEWSLDEKTTGDIVDVIIDAVKNGMPKLEQYEKQLGDLLPGDASKKVMETLLDKVVRGDFDGIEMTIQDFGQAVASDYMTGLVIDMGLVEGVPVADIQKAIQQLIASGYQSGVSYIEVLNQAINGGCFGDGTGGQGISATIQNGQVVIGNGIVGTPGITAAGVWGTIKAKIQTVALPKLEEFAAKQIDKWIAKNPTVQKWLTEIFGIDGQSIVNGMKNIWGVLTSNGTLAEKFTQLVEMAQNALCDMAKHALQWGLGKLQSWLSNIANKLISKFVNWLAGKIQNFLAKFGITIPQNLINKVQAWLQNQVGKGVQKVVNVLDQAGTAIIDQFRPGGGQTQRWTYGQQQQQQPQPTKTP